MCFDIKFINLIFIFFLSPRSFHFSASLNSHRSKQHKVCSEEGETFKCKFCTSVTNSKQGMRRHLKVAHKTQFQDEDYLHKCKYVCLILNNKSYKRRN